MSKQKLAYLKIGNQKAHTFYDPKTKVSIANHQVVSVPYEVLKEKSIKHALRTLHIATASEQEFNDYTSKTTSDADKQEMDGLIKEERKKFRQKEAKAKAKEILAGEGSTFADEDEDDDDDDEDTGSGEDDDDEDDDDEPTLTKSEMIDAIKASSNIPDEEKKGVAKKTLEDLKALYERTKD